MWVAALAITSLLLLPWGGSGFAMAEGPGSSTPSSRAAGEAKAGSARGLQKPVSEQPKKTKASPNVARAPRPEPDGPVLNLLWLLTGASRRH